MKGILLLVLLLVSCGDEPTEDFVACGGDVMDSWDFVTARALAAGDGCADTTASGFLVFQPNGRYSMNANIRGWKMTESGACGFNTAYGGFYRVEGGKICFGDSSAEGSAIPCEGTPPTTQHGVAQYCVENGRLILRSENLLGLRFLGEMELKPSP